MRDMQTPDNPRDYEVARLNQRCCHNRQSGCKEPNDDEADLNRHFRRPEGLALGLGYGSPFRHIRVSGRMRKRLYAEPVADIVYWNSEIFERGVSK